MTDEPEEQPNAIGSGRPSAGTEGYSVQESLQNVLQQRGGTSCTQTSATNQRKTKAQLDLEEKTRQGLTAVARAAATEQQRQVMEHQRQQRQQQQPVLQPQMQMVPVIQPQGNLQMFESMRSPMFGNL